MLSLPHHGVLKFEKETTKLRVVFDGSSRPDVDSPSINECLEKGPNLVYLLFDTIIKLRSYPVGIVSDIEKAFHQVQISPSDRCMLRFLWFDDVKKDNPVIKRFQFRRLVFGLTPSPAVFSTVIQNHLSQHRKEDADASQVLKDSLYVEDFAGGANNDQEAIEFYNKSRGIVEKLYGLKGIGKIIDCRRYSSNAKLLRVTSYVLRFMYCSKDKKTYG